VVSTTTRVASGLSLKGCQIVAGGRSLAQTTGQQSKMIPTPGTGVRKNGGTPSGVRTTWALLSGGLRYAATTGYYLTALQAEPTRSRVVVLTSGGLPPAFVAMILWSGH
jgi:hypothetical protein